MVQKSRHIYPFLTLTGILLVSLGVIGFMYRSTTATPLEFTRVNNIRWALFQYAAAHNGEFPTGKSSTEVFQHLIDTGYVGSKVFWFDLPGKVASANDRISSNNVCFDFTKGTNSSSPDWVPLVIPTGYKVNYKTGEAIRLDSNVIRENEIEIAYINDIHRWILGLYLGDIILYRPNRISIIPDKPPDADVSIYQQLTPDGSL